VGGLAATELDATGLAARRDEVLAAVIAATR